jgi:hypothetical protein
MPLFSLPAGDRSADADDEATMTAWLLNLDDLELSGDSSASVVATPDNSDRCRVSQSGNQSCIVQFTIWEHKFRNRKHNQ